MKHRTTVTSGSPYEPIVGYSRAVRTGSIIAVGGTAPLGPDGKTVGIGDAATQARRCFEIQVAAVEELGARREDIVRTRIMLTRREDWEAVARVHGEFFSDIRPASTIVVVKSFIDPDWLIETEMDAALDFSTR